jgi:hypothetical protein
LVRGGIELLSIDTLVEMLNRLGVSVTVKTPRRRWRVADRDMRLAERQKFGHARNLSALTETLGGVGSGTAWLPSRDGDPQFAQLDPLCGEPDGYALLAESVKRLA